MLRRFAMERDRWIAGLCRRVGSSRSDYDALEALDAHGPLTPPARKEQAEVQLRVGVRSEDRQAVERFTREIAPLVLNGPPSVTGFAGGRPKVEEIVAYWPALIDKRVIQPSVGIV